MGRGGDFYFLNYVTSAPHMENRMSPVVFEMTPPLPMGGGRYPIPSPTLTPYGIVWLKYGWQGGGAEWVLLNTSSHLLRDYSKTKRS